MGYSDKAKKYKVSEWFDEWMKLYKIGRIKTNTVRGYVDGFERATDFIGSVRLCIGEISALLWSDIQRSRLLRRIGNHICLVYIHISFGILLSRE